ncbi:hypothetical protein ACE02Z_05050 [Shewanella xiamenensis]|uniref:hypothetical protein n=1 Tax=Shewanella xiamenensis TaxID=332186 RepID=UPI00313DEA02
MEMSDEALNRYTQRMAQLNSTKESCNLPAWVLNNEQQWQFHQAEQESIEQAFYRAVQSAPMTDADWFYLLVTATDYISRHVLNSSVPVWLGESVVFAHSAPHPFGQTVYDPISKCDRYYPRCDTSAKADAIPPSDGQCDPEYSHHAPLLQDQ